MNAARILPRDEQPPQCGRAIGGEFQAAHHVVRGRNNLHACARQIESAIGTALDHALELAAHIVGAEMRHRQPHTTVWRRASGTHLRVDGPRDDIARGAFAAGIVVLHEALAAGIEQVTTAPRSPSSSTVPFLSCSRPRAVQWDEIAPSPCRAAAIRPPAPSRGRRSSCHRRACGNGTWSVRHRSRAARPSPRHTHRYRHAHRPARPPPESCHRRWERKRAHDAPQGDRCRAPTPVRPAD